MYTHIFYLKGRKKASWDLFLCNVTKLLKIFSTVYQNVNSILISNINFIKCEKHLSLKSGKKKKKKKT